MQARNVVEGLHNICLELSQPSRFRSGYVNMEKELYCLQ